nr:unnamed protein product [Digitaria exilis]
MSLRHHRAGSMYASSSSTPTLAVFTEVAAPLQRLSVF